MNHLHAKEITDRLALELELTPEEACAVRLVGLHETHYGDAWKDDGPGQLSNNWGANTTNSTDPATTFRHGDSRFDPKTAKVVKYETNFPKYETPLDGARGLALVLLFNESNPKKGRRENVAEATRHRSIVGLAAAMRMNRYYLGTKPLAASIEDYTRALQRAWAAIKAETEETLYDVPLGRPSSEGAPELDASTAGDDAPTARPFLQSLSHSLPVLRRNNRGDLVGVLQFELGVEPDELFGPKTEAAVRAFQSTHGLEPCGIVTEEVWAKLFSDNNDGETA